MRGVLFDLNEVRAVFESAWRELENRSGKSRTDLEEWPEVQCFLVDGKMVMRSCGEIATALNEVDTMGWKAFSIHFENVHLYFSKLDGFVGIRFEEASPFIFFTEKAG